MTQLNPFVAAILPAAQAQKQQAAERTNQVRRAQAVRKNVAHQPGDTFEHTVESADALAAVNDDDARRREDSDAKRGLAHSRENENEDTTSGDDQPPPRLDVTA